MAKNFPLHPAHPERICWGCDRYCKADALLCGNGTVATLHPSELFGDDWMAWGLDAQPAEPTAPASPAADAATGAEGPARPPGRPGPRG